MGLIIVLIVIIVYTIIIVHKINEVIEMIQNFKLPIKNLDCLALIYDYDMKNQTFTVEPVEISNYNSKPEEFDIIKHPELAEVVALSKAVIIEIFDGNLESKKASLAELLKRLDNEGKLLYAI